MLTSEDRDPERGRSHRSRSRARNHSHRSRAGHWFGSTRNLGEDAGRGHFRHEASGCFPTGYAPNQTTLGRGGTRTVGRSVADGGLQARSKTRLWSSRSGTSNTSVAPDSPPTLTPSSGSRYVPGRVEDRNHIDVLVRCPEIALWRDVQSAVMSTGWNTLALKKIPSPTVPTGTTTTRTRSQRPLPITSVPNTDDDRLGCASDCGSGEAGTVE